ncbi:MAG: hypothetical protein HXY51_14410 [Nitrospirae bacterium]|nr:hypothetical protein [Nitrospirota bacterium]
MARTIFGKKATLNIGYGNDGLFAVVTRGRQQVGFSRWATREGAEKWKTRIDKAGGCGPCLQKNGHDIVDLGVAK